MLVCRCHFGSFGFLRGRPRARLTGTGAGSSQGDCTNSICELDMDVCRAPSALCLPARLNPAVEDLLDRVPALCSKVASEKAAKEIGDGKWGRLLRLWPWQVGPAGPCVPSPR